MTLTIRRSPSIGGTGRPVKIGKRTFSLPTGARVAHSTRNGGAVTYVLDRGRVYCLTERGEIQGIPSALLALVKDKIFGDPKEE